MTSPVDNEVSVSQTVCSSNHNSFMFIVEQVQEKEFIQSIPKTHKHRWETVIL